MELEFPLFLAFLALFGFLEASVTIKTYPYLAKRPTDGSYATALSYVSVGNGLASRATCAAICNRQQPAGACNVFGVAGNTTCKWGKLNADYLQQSRDKGESLHTNLRPGYRLYGHDDKTGHKEYDLETGSMYPLPTNIPNIDPAGADTVEYGFLAGDKLIKCFTTVCFKLHLGDGAAWIALPVHPYSKCGGWVAFDHFAYKAGGHAENNNFALKFAEGYIFYYDKEVWEPSIALPAPIIVCMDFIKMNNYRAMLAGGDYGHGLPSETVYIHDFVNPAAGWVQKANMPRKQYRMAGNAWINPADNREYVYTFGGTTTYATNSGNNNIDRFDVQANVWTTVGQMSDGGHWSTHGNLRAGNKFYLEAAERMHLAEFDPATETYTVINTTPAPWMYGMAVIYNGPDMMP